MSTTATMTQMGWCEPPNGTHPGSVHWLLQPNGLDRQWAVWTGTDWRVANRSHWSAAFLSVEGFRYLGPKMDGGSVPLSSGVPGSAVG